jgi:hypothetical protein
MSLKRRDTDVAIYHPDEINGYFTEPRSFLDVTADHIALPTMGDKLVSVGYDAEGIRMWSATTYAVYNRSEPGDLHSLSDVKLSILTGGDQVFGMSGAPVFNGCGLVGVGVALELSELPQNLKNQTLYVKSGTVVVHVKELMKLLSHHNVIKYALPEAWANEVIKIPTKSYCKNADSVTESAEVDTIHMHGQQTRSPISMSTDQL